MPNLVYRCPFCGTSHEIAESLIGDRVDCRSCGKPFEVAAPVAMPVQAAEGEKAAFRVVAGEGEVENPVLTVHPVLVRRHPLLCLGLLLVFLAGMAGIVLGLMGGATVPGNVPSNLLMIGGILLVLAAAGYGLIAWLQTRYTRLSVTNRRTVLRRGLLSRRTSEVRHKDVRNLQVKQTTLERLLGVGDLLISSAGQDDIEISVEGLSNPEHVAAVIRDMQ